MIILNKNILRIINVLSIPGQFVALYLVICGNVIPGFIVYFVSIILAIIHEHSSYNKSKTTKQTKLSDFW